MHKKIRLPWLVLFTALLGVLPAVHALAADAGFSVIPQMPENQAPTTKGYYDILVQPGQEQTLTATVSNKLDEEIVVTVEAVTASTNRNGIVDYTTSEGATLDESMAYAFADLVRIPEKTISIPPGSGKTIAFTVTMPDQPFDGIILGALHVKKELSEKERAEAGTIINQYSYAIGVRIAMSSDAVTPDFALGDVGAELHNYRASVVSNIRNIRPVLIKGMQAGVQILPKGGDTAIFEMTMDKVDMAPNSVFPFTVTDYEGYGLQPGAYLSKIHLEYKNEIWDFEKEFEIKAEQAAVINEGAVNRQTQTAQGTSMGLPLWALILIGAGCLLLLAVLILLMIVLKRTKSN